MVLLETRGLWLYSIVRGGLGWIRRLACLQHVPVRWILLLEIERLKNPTAVVPGYFATYWTKCLTWIRVLNAPDENFWMKTGYRVPDTPRGNTTPEDVKAGKVKTVPVERFPVRSFLISPDGSSKIAAGMIVTLRGIAFSGFGRVNQVEVSDNGGRNWMAARLGDDHGAYSFRTWEASWTAKSPGRYSLAVRATDEKGNTQPDEPIWNPGGYLWNRIERQQIVVGNAS